jgi:hypothetical protein
MGIKHIGNYYRLGRKLTIFMALMERNLNPINLITEMYPFMYLIYKDMELLCMIVSFRFRDMDIVAI